MRWISFFILGYLSVGLQSGIAHAVDWNGSGPNLVLIAMVFIAMNAPRDVALLGSLTLGFMQDLSSQDTMGLYAFSYGMAAMFVITTKQAISRQHVLSHFSLTLSAGIMTAVIFGIHGWIHPPGPAAISADGDPLPPVHLAFLPLFYTAIYSAILGIFILSIMQRIRGFFRFQPNRTRMAARWPKRIG
jgi:rod shape-determining protein MreD